MPSTLGDLIPRDENVSNDALLGRFLEYVEGRRLTLYPAQESAMLELFEEKNVILNTPTGSGKSLVATALHFKAIAQGQRSIYTCPIKALVNEKFMALCHEFGPDNVGLATGSMGTQPTNVVRVRLNNASNGSEYTRQICIDGFIISFSLPHANDLSQIMCQSREEEIFLWNQLVGKLGRLEITTVWRIFPYKSGF